jgi:hypothetical protein
MCVSPKVASVRVSRKFISSFLCVSCISSADGHRCRSSCSLGVDGARRHARWHHVGAMRASSEEGTLL